MNNEDVVYFELNNWFAGRDYPNEEPFESWCGNDLNLYFNNEEWVKDNKLVVIVSVIDMSVNWCITAPKSWVLKNCPKLLSSESTTVIMKTSSVEGVTERSESYSYSSDIREPDEDGDVYGRFGTKFLEYTEDNIGIHYDENDY